MPRSPAHLHGRQRRRRQEHADRPAAVRLAGGVRGPGHARSRRPRRNRTAGPIDFSLFTDGLQAEREQGITIDVAYRYFATARRKFILADTPGHEQYTRNMATGASTADVAILLVDARHGVREQSRRHARIARLLGISSFVLAVNKMDLVDFDRDVFDEIRDEFADAAGRGAGSTPFRSARCTATTSSRAERAHALVRRVRACSSISRPSRSSASVRRRRSDFRSSSSCGPIRTSAATPGRSLSGTVRVGDSDHGLAVGPRRRASRASSPGTATSSSRSRRCR